MYVNCNKQNYKNGGIVVANFARLLLGARIISLRTARAGDARPWHSMSDARKPIEAAMLYVRNLMPAKSSPAAWPRRISRRHQSGNFCHAALDEVTCRAAGRRRRERSNHYISGGHPARMASSKMAIWRAGSGDRRARQASRAAAARREA